MGHNRILTSVDERGIWTTIPPLAAWRNDPLCEGWCSETSQIRPCGDGLVTGYDLRSTSEEEEGEVDPPSAATARI